MSPRIKMYMCCQHSRQHTCKGNGYIKCAANLFPGVLIQCPRLLTPSALSGTGSQSTKNVHLKLVLVWSLHKGDMKIHEAFHIFWACVDRTKSRKVLYLAAHKCSKINTKMFIFDSSSLST